MRSVGRIVRWIHVRALFLRLCDDQTFPPRAAAGAAVCLLARASIQLPVREKTREARFNSRGNPAEFLLTPAFEPPPPLPLPRLRVWLKFREKFRLLFNLSFPERRGLTPSPLLRIRIISEFGFIGCCVCSFFKGMSDLVESCEFRASMGFNCKKFN